MTRKHKNLISKIVIYLVLLVMVFVSLFPIAFCLSASLRTQEDLFQQMYPFTISSLVPSSVTFENYYLIFTKYEFWRPIMNTLIVTLFTILLGCIFNSLTGFAFTFFEFKGKNFLYAVVMLSFMVPFESIAIPLYSVASKLGMVDTYAGMIIPAIADGLVAFLFIQFFKDVPVALLEAARVDGASWPRIFVKIIVPICKPVFVTAGLMIFMNQWNSYMWPLLVARSKEIRTIQIAISAFNGERSIQWTYIYAASLVSAIIPICMFLPFQKHFVAGITAGSVKG